MSSYTVPGQRRVASHSAGVAAAGATSQASPLPAGIPGPLSDPEVPPQCLVRGLPAPESAAPSGIFQVPVPGGGSARRAMTRKGSPARDPQEPPLCLSGRGLRPWRPPCLAHAPDSSPHPRGPATHTFGAEAAVHAVLLAQAADLQVRAGVHAGRAALQVHHVPGAGPGCRGRGGPLSGRGRAAACAGQGGGAAPGPSRGRHRPPSPRAAPPSSRPPGRLRQSAAVLQLPGRPPAWEHWRENSARVLHTQAAPGGHRQRSWAQASR